jgi:hypothetical protein
MSARAEADPAHRAGHALIRVKGAAAVAETPGFRMQRDAGWGDDKLGPGGWQSSDALLQPDRAEASGTELLLHVGWSVCRHLEAGVYEFSMPAAGMAQVGLSWPEIVPQHAGASRLLDESAMKSAVKDEAAALAPNPPSLLPSPVPTLPAVPPSPLPSLPPPAPGISKWTTIAASVVIALLLAGIGTYYWRVREPGREQVQLVPPAANQAPGLGNLSVPDVLARAPDVAAITAEGEQRLHSDRRDDGLLLLEAAADRADPAAAASLARLYDPVLFQPGGVIPRPDPRQAARYYRDAARGGADVIAAREALRQNLQTRVQAGDLGANLSLKDFWP